MQRNGVRFYISHMPLAYWVPYAAFKALGVPPAPLPLQLFNLLLHGLTAFFLYRFLATLVAGCSTPGLADAPLFAAVFYLLMPAPLWYHGNVYMSDMAVQLPWAWSLAAGAKAAKSSLAITGVQEASTRSDPTVAVAARMAVWAQVSSLTVGMNS